MKSLNCILLVFCLSIMLINSKEKTKNTKINSKAQQDEQVVQGTSLSAKSLEELYAALFSSAPGENCKQIKMVDVVLEEEEEEGNDKSKGKRFTTDAKWIKKWGYGPSSYLFDYLDAVFLEDFLKNAEQLYNELAAIDNKDSDTYIDKLALKKLIPESMKDGSHTEEELFKEVCPSYEKDIYDVSINTVQLHAKMAEWNWSIDSNLKDPAMDFITRYDFNGDGRLNPRELVIGAIMHNYPVYNIQVCKRCFYTMSKTLTAIFKFMDCKGDGALSAQQLWENIPKMKRNETTHDIFVAKNNQNIRTAAINDFIIKNGSPESARVSEEGFVKGILFGLWDRQVMKSGIQSGNTRNLKTLRWNNQTVDKGQKAYDIKVQKEKELAS